MTALIALISELRLQGFSNLHIFFTLQAMVQCADISERHDIRTAAMAVLAGKV